MNWLYPDWFWLTWIGWASFFALAALAGSSFGAFVSGFGTGVVALGVAFHWVPEAFEFSFKVGPEIAYPAFALLVLWEAIPFGLLSWLTRRTGEGRLWHYAIVGLFWVGIEFFWPKVFPWSVAHTQLCVLPLVQLAEYGGSPLISLCVILATIQAAPLVSSLQNRTLQGQIWKLVIGVGGVVGLLIVAFVFGKKRLQYWDTMASQGSMLRMVLVQVDPSYTDSIAKLRALSLTASTEARLVCWPECALGTYSLDLLSFSNPERTRKNMLPPLVELQPSLGFRCLLLAGGKSYPAGATEEGPFFQTAFLIDTQQQIIGRYFKQRLMPIGEYIPGQYLIPQLRVIAGLEEVIYPGKEYSLLELPNGSKIGVLMCYEDMVPSLARKASLMGAEVLISLANGSAFENPVALQQHLMLAQLRAVENRCYLARCTATGVTCVVTPTGKVLSRLPCNSEGVLHADVFLLKGKTFYQQVGYYFPFVCLIISISYILLLETKRYFSGLRSKRESSRTS
jgi:apolipoprotein N-acyltransferase